MSEENDDDFDLVIDIDKIDDHQANLFWRNLSANENAMEIIKKYKNFINWNSLSSNKNAIHILEQNQKKIVWVHLMKNEGATNLLTKFFDEYEHDDDDLINLASNKSKFAMDFIENMIINNSDDDNNNLIRNIKDNISKNESVHAINLMKKYPKLIDWMMISSNKSAMEIIEPNLKKISFHELCKNENAISIIKTKSKNQIYWKNLSKNKNAMDLLIKYPDEINWKYFSKNENAVDFLKNSPNDIDWSYLSKNKSTDAIDLLKQNQINIDWVNLAKNKNKKAIPLLMKFVKHMFVSDEIISLNEIKPKAPKKQHDVNYYYIYNGTNSQCIHIMKNVLHVQPSLKTTQKIINYIHDLKTDFCRKAIRTKYLTEVMLENDIVFYVENKKQEILGCIVFEIQELKNNNKQSNVTAFCTPHSTGNGKTLLHLCVKFGEKMGFVGTVLQGRKSAIPFYRKNGFTYMYEEIYYSDYYCINSKVQNYMPMEYVYSNNSNKKRKREEQDTLFSSFHKRQKTKQKTKSLSLTRRKSTHHQRSRKSTRQTAKKRNTI